MRSCFFLSRACELSKIEDRKKRPDDNQCSSDSHVLTSMRGADAFVRDHQQDRRISTRLSIWVVFGAEMLKAIAGKVGRDRSLSQSTAVHDALPDTAVRLCGLARAVVQDGRWCWMPKAAANDEYKRTHGDSDRHIKDSCQLKDLPRGPRRRDFSNTASVQLHAVHAGSMWTRLVLFF